MRQNKSKYNLIVSHVTDRIRRKDYKYGDLIPSINEFRSLYNLSRDTVFAGLRELRLKGVIDSNPGVGNFIASIKINREQNIFLLFNEFNEFKEALYNSFMESVGKAASVDLYFHNYNRKVFDALVNDAGNKYTTYIIMPGKFRGVAPLLNRLSGNVLLLDHFHPELKGMYSSVSQNFEKDTYEALVSGLSLIKKYKRIYLVQKEVIEPPERYHGLKKFCSTHGFSHDYIDTIGKKKIKKGDLFMVVKDKDLVDLLKQAAGQQLLPGTDFGIISYNDTPLKEILLDGITVISTDHARMGESAARLILENKKEKIKNPFKIIRRKSL